MRIQTIVALTDFSTTAEHALDRAALLAAHHGARLELLYAAEQQDAKFCDPQARLEQRARQLARRHGLAVGALPNAGVAAVLTAAGRADLLVMDSRLHGRRPWPARATGLLARVLRASACPVLVVQTAARAPYAHALVHASGDAGGALQRSAIGLQGGATVELFHAARALRGLPLACGEAFARALRSRRQQAQPQRARLRVSDAFEARRNRVGLATGGLDAVRQLAVQQQSTRADLLVLAHARRSLLRDLLQAGKPHRLLAGPDGVGCDVLLVPGALAAAAVRPQAMGSGWTQAAS
ncbi:universal stress protein [Pulveribacter suum]|uniref:Universal stress protein n=1 Tax=Pulveribacter suum TaxID=2116657 RepID=A0A2P1NJ07_9BURK|nr:universal stress protein [Pulveribacter suum]AVP57023.1 universal stress protein [Pulveribacter suum]